MDFVETIPIARRASLGLMVSIAFATACSSHADRFAYSGTVQADSASVGSTIGGRVSAVLASEGRRVKRGDVIVRFDDRQQRAAYEAALAQLSQAKAVLADLEAGPRQADIDKAAAIAAQAQARYLQAALTQPQQVAAAEQAVHSAQSDASAARSAASAADRDFARAERLFDQGAISAQARDVARTAAQSAAGASGSATARLRTAQAQLDAVRSGSVAQDVDAAAKAAAAAQADLALVHQGTRPDQIAQAHDNATAAAANVAAAQARLDEALVKAPADGVVDGFNLHVGDLVGAGAPVATIDEFGDPWARIYVAQSDLQHVRVGAAVQVRSDALGDATFSGTVESIDANAQFTPRDVQTASDRADLSFGVKIRIHDPNRALRAGTTAEVALP
jgi:HlyD family secretion protein